MPDVLAHETHRQHAAAARAADACRPVQREHVKKHRVAGCEFPADDGMRRPIRLDVGKRREDASNHSKAYLSRQMEARRPGAGVARVIA